MCIFVREAIGVRYYTVCSTVNNIRCVGLAYNSPVINVAESLLEARPIFLILQAGITTTLPLMLHSRLRLTLKEGKSKQ